MPGSSTPAARYFLGIGGGTGAGKTTIAETLAKAITVPVTVLPLDNYYRDRSDLAPPEREAVNYDHPDAYEWNLVIEHVEALAAGEPIAMPQYDFETHTRKSDARRVEPTPVVIIEGLYALYDRRVRATFDTSVYVQTDADVRVLRRIRRDVTERGRDVEDVVDQYLATARPMHEQFVAPTRRHADVVVPHGANESAIRLLAGGITSVLRDESIDVSLDHAPSCPDRPTRDTYL